MTEIDEARARVLQILERQGSITHAAISRRLRITRNQVTNLMYQLVHQQMVKKVTIKGSPGYAKAGSPAVSVPFLKPSGLALVQDLTDAGLVPRWGVSLADNTPREVR